MDRFKWLETRRGAWGAAFVLLAIGGVFSYLKPVVGIPLLLGFLIVGIVLIAQATKKANQAKMQDTRNPEAHADTTKQSPFSINNLALVELINTRVLVNHGHADGEGILTELNDGIKSSDILRGKCTRCGNPRNRSTRRGKGY